MLSIEIISLVPERKIVRLSNVNHDATLNEIIVQVCREHVEICKYYDEQILLILHGSSIFLQKDEIKRTKLSDILRNHEVFDDVVKIYITPVLEGG